MARINLTVDGAQVSDDVEPRMLLVQYLREKLGKTGTVIGCDTSNCGACTVHLDGTSVKSCNVLAVQADGREVTTIEGLSSNGTLHPVQEAFRECHGLQCGFCTPGMIMQSIDLLNDNPNPSEAEIRLGLEGNLCRCTGYHNIVRAVQHAAGCHRGGEGMTATQERQRGRDRPRPAPQGGPAADHRPHPVDRQHHPARDAAPGHGAQPVRPREDHQHRHQRGQGRRPTWSTCSPAPTSPTPRASTSTPGRSPPTRSRPTHLPMPSDRVAFAGEIVACVIARTPAEARDAAELVDVDYEELPAALDLKAAANDEVLAHPDLGTNKSALWVFNSGEAGTGGNVDEAIEKARGDGIVIEREYRQQRLIPAFMEPRSVVVDPTSEQMTMWSATQIPHILRFALAATTGVPESKIRVIAPDVGGGFGGKLQTTPEEFIAWAVARRLQKPVKYTETRSESLVSGHHGRDQWQKLTLSAEKDGTVTGFKVELLADMGAYVSLVGGGVPVLGAFMYNAIYKFPAYHFQVQTVLTNKTWTDAYRGAGRPEATYAIERIMDELAAEVGVDPLEIREKNWIKHEEFPFTTVCGLEYDSGNYEAATARAKEMFGYDELRAEQKRRRDAGDPVQLGLGVSTFTEMCGLAPSRVLGSLDYGAGGWEHASVRMLPTGKVEVVTGASAHGQGHETAFSQIVADRLGVPFEDVEVLHGDTQVARQGLRHLRLAVAGGRRRGAGPGRRQGDREGEADRGAPARGVGRRPRVHRRPVPGQGHRPGAWRSASSPPPCSPRTTCPTGSRRRSTRTRRTTR